MLAKGHRPLRITAILPSGALTAETPLRAQIDLRVTNVSASTLDILTDSSARLTVAQNGIVVTTPAPQRGAGRKYRLQPEASHDYKSSVNLRRCDRAPAAVPVRPGSYQLYAAQPFILVGENDDRTVIVVQAGPWDIEIA